MELTGLQQEIWKNRYAFPGEQSWSDTARRVANAIAKAENDDVMQVWADKFYDIINNGYFIPGGRILFGSARRDFNMLNCYSIGVNDNIESIGKMIQDTYRISCQGGGIGYNFSSIRPKGDSIQNIKAAAPGSVSVMQMINEIGNHVRSGGSRRTALIAILNVTHPDLIDFLHVKLDLNQLNNFNISVGITNAFVEAVKKNKEWYFIFNNKRYDLYKAIRINKNGLEHTEIQIAALSEEDAKTRLEQHCKLHFEDEFTNIKKQYLKAKEIWDLIIKNSWKCGDPGFYNIDMANTFTNVSYFERLENTNPCIVGDTLVAVADGRGSVSMRELANLEQDVPVYCINQKGKLTIETMRHPRVTGYKQPIYKITIDNGHVVRVTPNHKFLLTNNTYKEAKNLQPGDSLQIVSRYEASLKDIFPNCNSNSGNYIWLNNGIRSNKSEHRMIYEFHNGPIPHNHVIHHIDFNCQNNFISNLQCMSTQDHNKLHSQNMLGDNNPMRRAKTEWSQEKWDEYINKQQRASRGLNNANAIHVDNTKIKEHALLLTQQLDRIFSRREWKKYAKDHGLPTTFSKWRKQHLNNGVYGLALWAAETLGLTTKYSWSKNTQIYKFYKKLLDQNYNVEIINNKVYVIKYCEQCNTKLTIPGDRREINFCQDCANKKGLQTIRSDKAQEKYRNTIALKKDQLAIQQLKVYTDLKFSLNRKPLKKEWTQECDICNISSENGRASSPFRSWKNLEEMASKFNHRVVKVEKDGYEDVYNGTVDKFHNFYIGGWEEKTTNNKKKWIFINSQQCGELPLPDRGNCCLGHVNLSEMYDELTNDVDWKKLASTIHAGIRFLDDTLSINHFPIVECKEVGGRSRRIGLGVVGLHYLLIKLGYKYGDERCLKFLERLFATFRNESYIASIDIAKEKGSFPTFDSEKYLLEGFASKLPQRIRTLIKKYGIRNAVMLTIAPTGTVSMVLGVSSGIEPIFAPVYERSFRDSNVWKTVLVGDKLFLDYIKAGKDTSHIIGAHDITVEQHLAVQATIQQYIDSAISKTVNLPEDFDVNNLIDLSLSYIQDLKGLTFYRTNSRGVEPLKPVKVTEEILSKLTEAEAISIDSCKSGVCEL